VGADQGPLAPKRPHTRHRRTIQGHAHATHTPITPLLACRALPHAAVAREGGREGGRQQQHQREGMTARPERLATAAGERAATGRQWS